MMKKTCSFWLAGKCLKGENCDWPHVESTGSAPDGGGNNPGAGGGDKKERDDDPTVSLCDWTSRGKVCFGNDNGRCKKRHKILDADNLGTGPKGAGDTKLSALEVTVLDADQLRRMADVVDMGMSGCFKERRVVAAFDSADSALGKGAVLVDSGANEVVRPFQRRWYDEIWRGEKGRPLTVNMADGKNSFAAMTQHGEVMLPVEAEDRTPESARWIVPTCRMIYELGCSLNVNSDGMVINFPGGKKIVTIPLNGLNFITWRDFIDIKNSLAESHHQKRRNYQGVFCKSMDVASRLMPGGDGASMDMDSENHWLEWVKEERPKGDGKEGEEEPKVEINNMQNCRGTQYEKECGKCVKARGIRRAHRKGAMVHNWNLSAGLSDHTRSR